MSAPSTALQAGSYTARTRLSWVRVVLAAVRVQIRGSSPLSMVIAAVVQPVAFALITLTADAGGSIDPATALFGSGLIAVWSATVWQAGMVLRRELWAGTLPGICSRPGGLGAVVVGKAVAAAGTSALVTLASLGVFAMLYGTPVHLADPLVFAAALLLGFAAALPLGLLIACLFLLTGAAIRIAEVIMYPVLILGGLLIPLDQLPAFLRPVSSALSLHWTQVLLIGAADGHTDLHAWWALLLTGAVYTAAARAAFGRVVHAARKEGSLEIL
ncbi:ABC transporter permease [Streptomyces sp. NBC_00582]|uniref:ABC transporter permease n=1 Tax=Streptomyces sp. NBC_00582 TaxID=2975783 RepID=UPI00106362DC|nr:ABC transporter permease [Streptomyces sp. NBC_00582]WUB59231.1 ABC transporter permease [Streptomyces sp. NBC_00582]